MDLVPADTERLLATAVGVRAARRLTKKGATLREISKLGVAELRATYDLTPQAAERLAAVSEIGRRTAQEPLRKGQTFRSSREVFRHYAPVLGHLEVEQFRIVLLDGKHRVMSEHLVSQGTLTSSPVHPREVFKPAIRSAAAAIVLVHNHPSGDVTPSADDLEVTRRLVDVGELIGIQVLDHVIVSSDAFTSLADRGLMR